MDDLPPEITKKYEVLEKMGEGGMGAVYKVRHRRVGTFQVIKLIRAPLQAREDLRERFRREAMTAMQLRHPNIVEVTDYDVTEDGTAHIVMEFIQGVNLREILARAHGPLDHRFVVNIAQQALAALGYMHRKKNVHRDISPDNFVLTRDDDGNPHVKLIDLGITKSTEQRTLTKAKGFLGKASYAPPEQFRGEADTRSDLYAFGVMLYELLTDSRPIVGANELAIMASHVIDPPRPFSESDPAGRVPDRLRAIIMKALEKDPAARWQTAQEFVAALKTCEAPLLEKTIEVTIPILLADVPTLREGEQEDWDEAKAVDSIVAWERYLERNPHSPRSGRARIFLEALESREEQDWQGAANADTIEGWREFIGNHADSPRESKARRRLEKLERLLKEERAWTEAAAADSVASWRRFLTEHATSARADEARGRAAQAKEREDLARAQEQERSARVIALRIDTEDSLLAFLESFPSSPAAAEVRQRIVALEAARIEAFAWEAALAENTVAAWKSFIDRHPTSRKSQAQKHLLAAETAARREVQAQAPEDTHEAYNTFPRNHPSKETATEPKQRLAEDELQREKRNTAEERRHAEIVEAWRSADEAGSYEALLAFTRKFPHSTYAAEARGRLPAIENAEQQRRAQRADESAWEGARASKAYDWFARTYPRSPHVAEARRLAGEMETRRKHWHEEQAWKAAKKAGKPEEFGRFLQEHPESAFVDSARRALEEVGSYEPQAVKAEALRRETAKYQPNAIDWLWDTLTTGKSIGCFSGGLIAVGALLVVGGWSVVIAKGPQGWYEMAIGAVVLAAASYRLLRWSALACVIVVLVVMAVIAYDQRFQPSPRSQFTATVGPSTTNSTAPAGAGADP